MRDRQTGRLTDTRREKGGNKIWAGCNLFNRQIRQEWNTTGWIAKNLNAYRIGSLIVKIKCNFKRGKKGVRVWSQAFKNNFFVSPSFRVFNVTMFIVYQQNPKEAQPPFRKISFIILIGATVSRIERYLSLPAKYHRCVRPKIFLIFGVHRGEKYRETRKTHD